MIKIPLDTDYPILEALNILKGIDDRYWDISISETPETPETPSVVFTISGFSDGSQTISISRIVSHNAIVNCACDITALTLNSMLSDIHERLTCIDKRVNTLISDMGGSKP
jgi:hypothetical protein